MQSTDRSADIAAAEQYASRALALGPNSYHARHARARVLVAQKRADEALIEAEHSLRLNPSFIPTYLDLSQVNLMLGFGDKPSNMPLWRCDSVHRTYTFTCSTRRRASAISCWDRTPLRSRPCGERLPTILTFPSLIAYRTAALALSGQATDAQAVLKQYQSLSATKTRTIADWQTMSYSDHPAYLAFRERIHDGLRKAGMQEA